jgi:exodeoxyribonuclease VII small subunit
MPAMAKKDEQDGVGFEESLAAVEAIIGRIESGEAGLEESIREYERGMGLIKRCRAILDRAEQRIEELSAESLEDSSSAGADGDDE